MVDHLVDRLAHLELEEKRNQKWPLFNSQKESFTSFIRRVNEFSNANARTEADAFRSLPLMLSEEYLDAYREVVNADDNWRSAIKKIQDHVLTPEKRAEYMTLLSSTRQESLTVAKFAQKIKDLANNATQNEDARKAIALNAFLAGLNSNLRKEVRKKLPTSLDEAIRYAKNLESIEKLESQESIVSMVEQLTSSINALRQERRKSSQDRRGSSQDRRGSSQERRGSPQERRGSSQDQQGSSSDRRGDRRGDQRGRPRRFRGRGSRRPTTNFLFAGIVMSCCIGLANATFVDCATSMGGLFLKPPQKANCSMREQVEMKLEEVKLWKMDQDDQQFTAWRCTKETYQRCTNSVLFISSFNQSLSHIEAVDVDSCRSMIRTKQKDGRMLIQVDPVTHANDLENEDWPARSMSSTICHEVRRYVLQNGSVSRLGDSIITPLLLNTKACTIREGLCTNEVATVIWTPPTMRCSSTLIGSFEAQITKTTLVIPSHQSAFTFSDQEVSSDIQNCFPDHVLATTSAVFVSIVKNNGRHRREINVTRAYQLMDSFLSQRRLLPTLSLRQFHKDKLPQLLDSLNITEYKIEKHMRLHPTKDTSLAILQTMIEEERLEAVRNGIVYPSMIYQDTPVDYSPTEAESWITLAKILFREVKEARIISFPIAKETTIASPVRSYVGSAAHIHYMKTEYDRREDHRRNITSTSRNAKLQYHSESVYRDMKKNFAKISSALCETNNRQIDIWMALLRIDPTVGLRALLQRQDIEAHFVGTDTLLVSQCKTVEVTEIITSKRINSVCYTQTPVKTSKNITMFITPGSQELVSTAKVIPCEEVQPDPLDNSTIAIDLDNKMFQPFGIGNGSFSTNVFNAPDILDHVVDSSFPVNLAISFGENLQSLKANKKLFVRPTVIDQMLNAKSKSLQEVARLGGYAFDATSNTVKDTIAEVKDFYKEYLITAGTLCTLVLLAAILAYIALNQCCGEIFSIFAINAPVEEQVHAVEPEDVVEEPLDYEEAVKPFLPKFPPMMTYLPVLMSLVNNINCSDSLPFIPITIKDRMTVALWDSGSSVTYLRESTLNYINESSYKKVNMPKAKTANGSSFSFLGCTKLPIRIGSIPLEVDFLIAEDENCPAAVLLGYDFMKSLESQGHLTTLLPGRKQMLIGQCQIPLIRKGSKIYQHRSRKVNIISIGDASVQPGRSTTLRITFDTMDDEAVHLQPVKKSPLTFDECIINPWINNMAEVKVTNNGREVYHVAEGSLLGIAPTVDNLAPKKDQVEEMPSPEADYANKFPNMPKTQSEFEMEFDAINNVLNSDNKLKLRNLVMKYRDAFFNEDGKIGCFKGPIRHCIELEDKQLPRAHKTRIPYKRREEVRKIVEEMRQNNLIEDSDGIFTSPIVLVKKKDGTIRFVVDFRLLNSFTKKINYIIPCVTEILDLAAGKFVYSSLDFISGFFQIPLRKEDRHLTSFETEDGTFQFKVMPMGLCGSPHTFQQVARFLQKKVKAKLFAYMDDLLLVSSSEEQHLADLEELFNTIIKYGLKLKLKKCKFAQEELEFLGFVIGRNGLKPNPKKVQSIQEYPVPSSPTAVRSFLGMIGYFRRFVENFSGIAAPLHDLTKKETPFIWTSQHQEVFDRLKKALLSPPILVGPNLSMPYVLETDASLMAVAGVLLQKNDNGKLQAIAYGSRKLNKAERNYSPLEAEALAIVFCLKHFRQYVLGSHVDVITDHKPLTSLMHRKDLEGRLQKYQLSIQDFDITIIYRPGRQNVVADALSRFFDDETNEPKGVQHPAKVNIVDIGSPISAEEIIVAQKDTEWMRQAFNALQDPNLIGRKADAWRKRFIIKDGILRQKSDAEDRIVIPRDHPIKKRIIERFHNSPLLASHMGVEKTLFLVKNTFVWTNMKFDVMDLIRRCHQCNVRKPDSHHTAEPMGSVERFPRPALHWHVDHIGPLPVTERGNRFILVAKDPYSKYIVTAAVDSLDAETTTEVFLKNIIAVHGVPNSITSDNGSSFKSSTFQQLLKTLGIKQIFCAPYHHQSNGIVERANRSIEECLSAYVNKTQDDWDEHLPLVTFALNAAAPSSTTKAVPFEVIFGRRPVIPEDLLLKKRMTFGDDYQTRMTRRLEELFQLISSQQLRTSSPSPRKTKEKEVSPGEWIYVKREAAKNKLAPRLKGPFQVKQVAGKNVRFLINGKEYSAHKDDVRDQLESNRSSTEDQVHLDSESNAKSQLDNESMSEADDESKDVSEDKRDSETSTKDTPRRSERLRKKNLN